jgi:hypothetical protein
MKKWQPPKIDNWFRLKAKFKRFWYNLYQFIEKYSPKSRRERWRDFWKKY